MVPLASALLPGAHRVAVVEPRLSRPLSEDGRQRGLVGELLAVVREHGAEHPAHAFGSAERAADEPEPRLYACRRLLGEQQRKLEARGAVVQGEQALPVEPLPAFHRVHLPGALPDALGKGAEGAVRPVGGMAGGMPASASAVLPGLVRHLAPELHVGEPGIAPVYPFVDRGGAPAELGMRMRDLLGREPSCEAVLYHRHLLEEAALGLVDAPPGLREDGIGLLLREAGIVEHARLPAASVALPVAASVAASGPCAEPGACIPEPLFGRMLPCLRLRRRDVAVPLDLVVHGRGRPSQQLRDLPAAVAAVEAFLDKPPLRLRQPQICPGLGLPPFLPGSSGHAMSASSCTSSGRPLRPPPHRLRHPSAHVQLTSGTVRMKSVIDLTYKGKKNFF